MIILSKKLFPIDKTHCDNCGDKLHEGRPPSPTFCGENGKAFCSSYCMNRYEMNTTTSDKGDEE